MLAQNGYGKTRVGHVLSYSLVDQLAVVRPLFPWFSVDPAAVFRTAVSGSGSHFH